LTPETKSANPFLPAAALTGCGRRWTFRNGVTLIDNKENLILAQTGCYCKFNIEATRFTGGG
jgi:hypothetical protein